MPYCTQSDILERISIDELIGVTDDAGAGIVDTSVVARAIADADAEIDSYAASRYSVPFATVPAMIRKISVEIAVYNLFARRRGATSNTKERYDAALKFLKSVANGEVTLGADAPAESADDGIEASVSVDDRIFTKDTLSGF
jgi:phage gp36-like protein